MSDVFTIVCDVTSNFGFHTEINFYYSCLTSSSTILLFPLRYILESGEFRLGAGPQADCRLDSWTENPLCASFELQLSQAYQPVCDYACAMWSPDSDNAYVNREYN